MTDTMIVKAGGTPSIKYFLKQRDIQINLAIMAFAWLSCSFNFYLIGF